MPNVEGMQHTAPKGTEAVLGVFASQAGPNP